MDCRCTSIIELATLVVKGHGCSSLGGGGGGAFTFTLFACGGAPIPPITLLAQAIKNGRIQMNA